MVNDEGASDKTILSYYKGENLYEISLSYHFLLQIGKRIDKMTLEPKLLFKFLP